MAHDVTQQEGTPGQTPPVPVPDAELSPSPRVALVRAAGMSLFVLALLIVLSAPAARG